MTGGTGPPDDSALRRHACTPPERGHRGQTFECWCGRDWVATASLTIRGNRITSLRPDWRLVGIRPPAPAPPPPRPPRRSPRQRWRGGDEDEDGDEEVGDGDEDEDED